MGEILLESDAQALTDALESAKSDTGGDTEDQQSQQGGSPEPSDTQSQTEDEASDGSPEPLSAEKLAELANIPVADLYTRLQLKIDDEVVTLEQYKDRARDLNNVDLSASELAREKATFQAERLKQTEQLNTWVSALQSGQATSETVAQIQQQSEQLVQMAETRTRSLIPEWKDGEVAKADKAAIGSMLVQFGLPQGSEEQIHDPNTWLMLRYFNQLDTRMSSALKAVREPKHKGHKAPAAKANKSALKGLSSDSAAMLEALRHGN